MAAPKIHPHGPRDFKIIKFKYVLVISKTLERIETFNTNYNDFS